MIVVLLWLALSATASQSIWQKYFLNSSEPLPNPTQTSHRLLVSVTAAHRYNFLLKQLNQYAELCELGYEVHVTVFTTPKLSMLAKPGSIATHYTCMRLQADVPYQLYVFDPSAAGYLTSFHRILWDKLSSRYDFFQYQEDDVLIKPSNVLYLAKWHQRLEDTVYHPTLKWYEVPVQRLSNSTLVSRTPMFITTCCQTTDLVVHNGDTLVVFGISYVGSYFLSQKRLQKILKDRKWIDDIAVKYSMYNEHFGHFWLPAWGYTSVVPVSDFNNSLVHHQTNRYIHFQRDPQVYAYNRGYLIFGVDIAEFWGVLQACYSNVSNAAHNISSNSPHCPQCFAAGQVAHLAVNYTQYYPSPEISVKQSCSPNLVKQMKSEPCKDQVNTRGGFGGCEPLQVAR
jgi:hypothetical protein